MRVQSIPGNGTTLRAALRATALCLAGIALLTCTPPNFGGDPEPEPLVLSPISASIYVETSITITISGGTPAYSVSVDHGGSLTKLSDTKWSFHATSEVLATITVTDMSVPEKFQTAEINVSAQPAVLTISPDMITLQVGDTFQFDAVGGTSPYEFNLASGVGSVDPDGLYHATAVGHASIEVTDSDGPPNDQAEVDVVDPAEWNARSSVDANKAGLFASLALDGLGTPSIAYYETVGKDLKLARWTSTWELNPVDATFNAEKHPSLIIDASGRIHIAWYEASNGSLRYSSKNGSTWDPMQIVVASNVGPYVSLAVDGSGHPHIAYCQDDTYDHLRYVEWNGTSWLPPVLVDNDTANTGHYVSLALDTSDNPRIAHYDASNGKLKYAYWTGLVWNYNNEIDDTADVGQYASLKIKPDGSLRVAYYDVTNGNLKYAENSGVGTGWTVTTVDESAHNVGQYASLALDPTDQHPHIAYYDATNGDLRYAARTVSIWFSATVDAGPGSGLNNVGMYASLAVDPLTGAMKIAYHDATATDLLYITEQP